MWLTPICSVIVTEEQRTEAFAQWGGRKVVMRQMSGFQSEQWRGCCWMKSRRKLKFCVCTSFFYFQTLFVCTTLQEAKHFEATFFFSWEETLQVASGIWHVSVGAFFKWSGVRGVKYHLPFLVLLVCARLYSAVLCCDRSLLYTEHQSAVAQFSSTLQMF